MHILLEVQLLGEIAMNIASRAKPAILCLVRFVPQLPPSTEHGISLGEKCCTLDKQLRPFYRLFPHMYYVCWKNGRTSIVNGFPHYWMTLSPADTAKTLQIEEQNGAINAYWLPPGEQYRHLTSIIPIRIDIRDVNGFGLTSAEGHVFRSCHGHSEESLPVFPVLDRQGGLVGIEW